MTGDWLFDLGFKTIGRDPASTSPSFFPTPALR